MSKTAWAPSPILAALSAVGIALAPATACAWGAMGHRLATVVAVENLPAELPPFLRTPRAIAWLGELGREPDRSKGAGHSHDRDRNPGHYLNLGDAGLVADAVPLQSLPADREHYDTLLRTHGANEYQAGYLPYSIVDGWQ